MKDTSKRLPVAERSRKGLEEALRHAKGEITLKATTLAGADEPSKTGDEDRSQTEAPR